MFYKNVSVSREDEEAIKVLPHNFHVIRQYTSSKICTASLNNSVK